MIYIKQSDYDSIIEHCKKGLPNEACGLLAGRKDGGDKYIEKVYLMTNIDESPEHFSLDIKEQIAVTGDIRKNALTLIGNFHSHPSTPARPSQEDIRLAFDKSLSYVIVSMKDEVPVLKSFSIVGGVSGAEEVTITE